MVAPPPSEVHRNLLFYIAAPVWQAQPMPNHPQDSFSLARAMFLRLNLLGVVLIAAATAAQADTLLAGYSTFNGRIETFDLDTGGLRVGTFLPPFDVNAVAARGLAVAGNEVFYTELQDTGEGLINTTTPFIHVAPFNAGAGGTDLRTIPNPSPQHYGLAALAFAGGSLYALTGYEQTYDQFDPPPVIPMLQVWRLDPLSGAVLGGPVTISYNGSGLDHSMGSDGFTVLPNGNFLINNDDASPVYEEFSALTGLPTGFSIHVPHVVQYSTGVDTDGTHLFFQADPQDPGPSHIIETDMTGAFVADIPELNRTGNGFEDISVVHSVPEPGGWGLFAAGFVAWEFFSRRGKVNRAIHSFASARSASEPPTSS
jgi:hypothetical protein